MDIYRHGDLLIKSCKKREVKNKGDYIKLALGEATGHHHTLEGKNIFFDGIDGAIKYFEITEPVNLTHQEHNTLQITPGSYEIIIEREYDYFEENIKNVVD